MIRQSIKRFTLACLFSSVSLCAQAHSPPQESTQPMVAPNQPTIATQSDISNTTGQVGVGGANSDTNTRMNDPLPINTINQVPDANNVMGSLSQPAELTDYDYAAATDSEWLIPLTVYDDNRFTYVRFRKTASLPAVFGRATERGEDYVLNSVVQNVSVIKIQGFHPYLVLRYGKSVVGLRRRSAP